MRSYARIDSLRRHVLRVHLNQASRHDHGLRGLRQHSSETPIEEKPVVCPIPDCGGLVLDGRMHYQSHAARVHKGLFDMFCRVGIFDVVRKTTALTTHVQAKYSSVSIIQRRLNWCLRAMIRGCF